jgi:hypothetical protein
MVLQDEHTGPLPDLRLSKLVKDLYERTSSREDALLEYLRSGGLTAVVKLPVPGLPPMPIPTDVWIKLPEREFKVRRNHDGKWHNHRFRLPLAAIVEGAIARLTELARAAFAKNETLVNEAELRNWFKTPPQRRIDVGFNWAEVHERLIERLCRISECKPESSIVYVLAVERDRFLQQFPRAKKGAGGRPAIASDEFFYQLIARLGSPQPDPGQTNQTTLIQDMLSWSKKQNIDLTNSWIRTRVSGVFRQMGWTDEK